jgi:hypothetical protein
LYILARPTLFEVIRLIVRRKPPEPVPADLEAETI